MAIVYMSPKKRLLRARGLGMLLTLYGEGGYFVQTHSNMCLAITSHTLEDDIAMSERAVLTRVWKVAHDDDFGTVCANVLVFGTSPRNTLTLLHPLLPDVSAVYRASDSRARCMLAVIYAVSMMLSDARERRHYATPVRLVELLTLLNPQFTPCYSHNIPIEQVLDSLERLL